MNEVNKIRKRIKKNENPKKEKILLKIFNCFLVFIAIGMLTLIYCKQDEQGMLLKTLFNVDVSFTEFNNNIENAINDLFKIESENEQTVNQVNYYNSIGNNRFCTDDKTVKMLHDGEVFALSSQEDYQYIVGVNYKNGVKALYTYIDEVNISLGDVIQKDSIIGTYKGDYFTCVFKIGDEIIEYNEVIQLL